ncbi:MAG: hypothetical protein Fur0022_18050 [Anaerolineales bacterium]
MKIPSQKPISKIYQLGYMAQANERITYVLGFGGHNAHERKALENQKQQLEAEKDRLPQSPDGVPLPRPPP